MFLSPPLQILPILGFLAVVFAKLKHEVLYNVASLLVSLHLLANAITFYILGRHAIFGRNIYLLGTQLPFLAQSLPFPRVQAVESGQNALDSTKLEWGRAVTDSFYAETAETEQYRQNCLTNRHFFGLAALFTVLAESKIWNWPYQILWRPKLAITK